MACGMFAKPAHADTSVAAYIVLRCTVTLSVALVDGSTYYNFGDVSPAATYYSAAPIRFYNNSQGAICSWDLRVDTNTTGWQIGAAPSLDQITLYGVFKDTKAVTGEDEPIEEADFAAGGSTLSLTNTQYSAAYFSIDPQADSGYDNDGSGSGVGDETKILPKSYADTVNKDSSRDLWLKLLTPLAVSSESEKTFYLWVTAKLAG
ncbi:MAG: hypothetical protein JW803_08060 [Endomicrobiales bacterium]|nr:hypothetical protein [Endomicrobiales bacterium]